jgi:hypothetical protein
VTGHEIPMWLVLLALVVFYTLLGLRWERR